MTRQIKCKICGNKIEKSSAYCIEKVSEKTGKVSRSYYCSQDEYEKDKYLKGLWREILLLYDDILGYMLEEILIAYKYQNKGLGSRLLSALSRSSASTGRSSPPSKGRTG